MNGDPELEMLLSEIPRVASFDQNHHNLFLNSPLFSSSSSSGAFCSSDDGFSPSVKNSNGYVCDELGLCENLRGMSIRNANKDYSDARRVLSSDFHGYEGFRRSIPGNSMSPYNAGKLMGENHTINQSNALYSEPFCFKNRIDCVMDQRSHQNNDSYNRDFRLYNPSTNWPYLNGEMCYPNDQVGMEFNEDMSLLNPVNSSQLVYPNMVLNEGTPLCNSSMLKEKFRAVSNGGIVPQSILSMTKKGDVEAFSCEDSFIIQGKGLRYLVDKGFDHSRGQKKLHHDILMQSRQEKQRWLHGQSQLEGIHMKNLSLRNYTPFLLQPAFSLLAQEPGYVYYMAKDQHGCRLLQKMFDKGNQQDVQMIFHGIINHVIELMMNPFGNYLMQKLLDVCNEEQRTQIILMVTEEPENLVRISLNTHGTRVVQKLIETLKTRQQILLVVSAVQPGFLDLIRDLNGNHVIQRCLEYLSKEDNEFIFDAAAKSCVDIATHQHGCCVLNRCIAQSAGKHREKLVAEIAAQGFFLAQDAYGNYVVQYIIELKIPSAAASLISQFEGHYVKLSMQKFSSHVVEKCLECLEDSHSRIIHELLSAPHFEQLLRDPYANYVIRSALKFCKGTLCDSLVKVIRPHGILRTSPYCKKIFSHHLLKK
ncbi:putative pumilio homolog 7, chloroplastic isoform X1 [Diospyros lotus]|uniref:putative pumilio homolog 7, chloroplastic isoform X1 n=1 Tax=Diospyros lotus TaxID=55363 RepID=UPI0022522D84|nr:putative pumilio homolog 7, chloroplastic isoform X1 [Diospyros lotus]